MVVKIIGRTPLTQPLGSTIAAEAFGLHFNSTVTADPALNLGAMRMWDNGLTWRLIEGTEDVYNWNGCDNRIALAERYGAEVLMTLGQAPGWASETSPAGDNYNPTPPVNDEDWTDYITAMVTRYKGRIHAYEIWNEPNASNFWNGTVGRLIELSSLAYSTIKSIDPDATVVSAAPSSAGLNYFGQMLAAGAADYADAIGFHFHRHPLEPEMLLDRVASVKAIMATYGVTKPIWNTEFGWGEYPVEGGTEDTDPMSEAQAASYIFWSYMVLLAGGIVRNFNYGVGHSWSLLRLVDGDLETLNDAGTAFNHVASLLTGGHAGFPVQHGSNGTLFSVDIVTGAGVRGRAYRCSLGETVNVDLSGYSSGVDVLGASITLSGSYAVTDSPIVVFA